MSSSKYRAACFTINNPDEEDFRFMDEMLGLGPLAEPIEGRNPSTGLRYLVFQYETGENGTRHIQGYVVRWEPMTFDRWKRYLPPGAHIERRRGTHVQARDYCMKDESRMPNTNFFEFGAEQQPRQGHRGDLEQVKSRLDSGAAESEIADEFFGQWCRYHKAFARYRGLKLTSRTWVTETQVYWGPPGTGKTRAVLAEAGPDAYWLPKPNGTRVFWDGYEGQEHVVIDEFFGWMPRDLMCRLCDRYPFRVETKGGSIPFVAKKVWITSNSRPAMWWPKVGLGPMRRRLTPPLGSCVEMPSLEGPPGPEGHGLEAVPLIIVD